MHDIVGRFWAIIFGVLLMYVGAIVVFANRSDTIHQNFITAETQRYVDTMRAKREFNEADYMAFLQKLDSTGETYDVTVTYYQKTNARKLNSDGSGNTGSEANIQEYYRTKSKEELLRDVRTIATNADGSSTNTATAGKVYFAEGDFIRVSVVNRTATKGEQFTGLITGKAAGNGGKLNATYGGYVGTD